MTDTPWSDPEHDVLGDLQRVIEARGLELDDRPTVRATSTARGSRPFLGWADELEAFRQALEVTETALKWQPSPEVAQRVRELLEAGTVHHSGPPFAIGTAPASSRLFDDVRMAAHDAEKLTRQVVEDMVARYAAEHPDEIRG